MTARTVIEKTSTPRALGTRRSCSCSPVVRSAPQENERLERRAGTVSLIEFVLGNGWCQGHDCSREAPENASLRARGQGPGETWREVSRFRRHSSGWLDGNDHGKPPVRKSG